MPRYAVRKRLARLRHVPCEPPGGKLPCASGTRSTQEAGTAAAAFEEESTVACVLRWVYALNLALAPWGASSVLFMTATQISHIQEVCQQDLTLDEVCPYRRQALTSLDHSTRSNIGHFLTGGLNLQVRLTHYVTHRSGPPPQLPAGASIRHP